MKVVRNSGYNPYPHGRRKFSKITTGTQRPTESSKLYDTVS